MIGTWAAVGAIALPAGPLIGGVLVSLAGWPLIFVINLPLCAAAMIIIALFGSADRPGQRSDSRLDLLGALLAVAVLGPITFAVIELREPAAGVARGDRDRGAHDRDLRPSRARVRTAVATAPAAAPAGRGVSLIAAGVMNLCSIGSLFLLTQWLQTVDHHSPLQTGLWLLPAFVPLPLLGRFAGRLTQRYGPWRPAAAGLTLGALGFAVLAASPAVATPPGVIGLALWGVGLGVLTPAVVAATVAALPDRAGLASGLSNTARQLGGALGVAAFATLAGPATTAAFVPATRTVLLAAAIAFTLTALALLPRRHIRRCFRGVSERM